MRSCAKIVPKLHGGTKHRLSILGRSESTKPNIVRGGEEVFIFPNNWFADLCERGTSSATLAVPFCCDGRDHECVYVSSWLYFYHVPKTKGDGKSVLIKSYVSDKRIKKNTSLVVSSLKMNSATVSRTLRRTSFAACEKINVKEWVRDGGAYVTAPRSIGAHLRLIGTLRLWWGKSSIPRDAGTV